MKTDELPHGRRGCTLRYAHDSLRTNYISKLATVYERDLGVTHDWNGTLRTGNPTRNVVATLHIAFVRKKKERQESKYHKCRLGFAATSRQSPYPSASSAVHTEALR